MEYIALNNICDVRDGTHDSPKYVQEGFPLVTSKNIVDGKLDLSTVSYITQEDYDKINERSKVDEGDIIMPMIGTIGNPLLIEDFCEFAIKNVALIKFPNQETCNKYIWYFLKSGAFKKYVDEKNKGGTQKFLSLGDIRGMKVPILEYSEQIAVVEKFDAVYKVISERNEELQLLDDLIKVRFVEMFGDPVSDNQGWGQKPLKEMLKNIRYGTSTPPEFVEEGYAFIRATNIKNGQIVENDMKYIPQSEADRLVKCRLYGGEILIVRSGVNAGDTCVVTDEYIGQYAGYDMILVLNKELNPVFLNILINTIYMDKVVKPLTRRAAQPHLNSEQVQSFPIIQVPIELQNQFADFVRAVDKSKVAVQKALDETQLLFDSLMQQYFG